MDDIFHAPKHPYTQALLQSIPRMQTTTRQRLTSIMESVPHPYARPSGCAFHPRCTSFIAGVCNQREPTLQTVAENHDVSCFLHEG